MKLSDELLNSSLFETNLKSLPLLARGKVRDIYAVGTEHLLLVATDRLSAFDVVMPDPIPGKGAVLTAVSNFWFERFAERTPNHLATLSLEQALPDPAERKLVAGRAVVVRRLQPLPIEAVVRGYLIGSGWKEYREHGTVCGIVLQRDIPLAGQLPEPIFTPATKAATGQHDENIDFSTTVDLIGRMRAEEVRSRALMLYREAAAYALTRGIIIADTKFEFGIDAAGEIALIDEALTPDSSRFWPADEYEAGTNPPSFDKQFVRDYLETLHWDKRPPGPRLPPQVIAQTAEKYREALTRLTK